MSDLEAVPPFPPSLLHKEASLPEEHVKDSPLSDINTPPLPNDLSLLEENRGSKDSYESSELSDLGDDELEAETDKMDFLDDDTPTTSGDTVSDLHALSELTELARLQAVDSDDSDSDYRVESKRKIEDEVMISVKKVKMEDTESKEEECNGENEMDNDKHENKGREKEKEVNVELNHPDVSVGSAEHNQSDHVEQPKLADTAEIEDTQAESKLVHNAEPEEVDETAKAGPDAKADDVKVDDSNADDSNADNSNADDSNADDSNADDSNADVVNADGVNSNEANGNANGSAKELIGVDDVNVDADANTHHNEVSQETNIEAETSNAEITTEIKIEPQIETKTEVKTENVVSDAEAEADVEDVKEEVEKEENEDEDEVEDVEEDAEEEDEKVEDKDGEESDDVDMDEYRRLAVQELVAIETDFALLRDKLFHDKLGILENELQLCLDGSHPELLQIYYKVNEFYQDNIRLANATLNYSLKCINTETVATRTAIHQDFMRRVIDMKNDMVTRTTLLWYKINRERNLLDLPVPDCNFAAMPREDEEVSKKTLKHNALVELVHQRNCYNEELGILNTLAEFHGIPCAVSAPLADGGSFPASELLLRRATPDETADDIRAMTVPP